MRRFSDAELDQVFDGINDLKGMLMIAVQKDIPPDVVVYRWMRVGGHGSGAFKTGLRMYGDILDIVARNENYRKRYADAFITYLWRLSKS